MLIRFPGLIQQIQLDGALLPDELKKNLQYFGAELENNTPAASTAPSIRIQVQPGCATPLQRQLTPDQHLYEYDDHQVALSLCDGQVRYTPDSLATLAIIDSDCPTQGLYTLGTALTRALALQGGVVLHGAVFRLENMSIIAIGPSGAGKSTLAMAAMLSGAQLLSDDMVLVGINEDGMPRLRALRPHYSLRQDTLTMLPSELRAQLKVVHYASETRWELDLASNPQTTVSTLAPDVLLLLLPRSGGVSQLEETSMAAALAALISAASPRYLSAPHTLERQRSLATLQALATQTRRVQSQMSARLLNVPQDEISALMAALAQRSG